MDALLIKTGGLLLIVALGYLLKRRGVFQQGDARLLSRIIVNLTLPGALLSSFSAFRLVPSLLAVLAAAAAANVLLLAVSALVTRRRPGPVRALYLLNAPSYNIGTFVLPFVQSFLPPDMLLAAMEQLGADPDKTVFVGDSEVDIATARAANLPCISVLWGFRDRDVLERAGAQQFAADAGELAAGEKYEGLLDAEGNVQN